MPASFLSVRELMQPEPVAVGPECPLRDVIDLLNKFHIGSVLIVSNDQALLGIFTDRDLIRKVINAQPGWRDGPISQWMTPVPHAVSPELGWEEVTGLMHRLNVRHLPVIENDRVVGIITARMLMDRRTEYLNRQVEERTAELRRANDELMARDADLRYNLRAAGRFQSRLLLPHSPPDWPELRWGIHFAPLDLLGGDYYDVAHPDPDHLGFLIADASGHSIAAMMVAIISRIAFSEVAKTTTSPGAVLNAMNERLQGLADERFVTAFYCVLNRKTLTLTFANAGHPYPLWHVARSGEVRQLSATGFMLGIMSGEQYRETTIQLSPGDRICFYTDGLVEARNEIGETLGMERLTECIAAHADMPAVRLAPEIICCQSAFRGSQPLSDDVTLVVAELMNER